MSVTPINYAFSFNRDADTHTPEPGLGLSALESYPSSSDYWTRVHEQLQILPRAAAERGWPISALVLLGENAGMPEFIEVLKDALSSARKTTVKAAEGRNEDTQQDANSEDGKLYADVEKTADPLWAAARGAALYARWKQELPWKCDELPECFGETVEAIYDGTQLPLGVDIM
jgi:hypothetical protein